MLPKYNMFGRSLAAMTEENVQGFFGGHSSICWGLKDPGKEFINRKPAFSSSSSSGAPAGRDCCIPTPTPGLLPAAVLGRAPCNSFHQGERC